MTPFANSVFEKATTAKMLSQSKDGMIKLWRVVNAAGSSDIKTLESVHEWRVHGAAVVHGDAALQADKANVCLIRPNVEFIVVRVSIRRPDIMFVKTVIRRPSGRAQPCEARIWRLMEAHRHTRCILQKRAT